MTAFSPRTYYALNRQFILLESFRIPYSVQDIRRVGGAVTILSNHADRTKIVVVARLGARRRRKMRAAGI
jgi:hypothetical protein